MKIEVDVVRIEQSWDVDTGEDANSLVISVFGLETKIPCSEEQVKHIIADLIAWKRQPYTASAQRLVTEPAPRQEPVHFEPPTRLPEREFSMPAPEPTFAVDPDTAPRARVPVRQVRRPISAGDDAGIEQG